MGTSIMSFLNVVAISFHCFTRLSSVDRLPILLFVVNYNCNR